MNIKKLILSLLTLVSLTLIPTASAQEHPGYLHALSDLRYARFLVEGSAYGPRHHYIVEEIDAAINEIKVASIDDGKNLNTHPPVDSGVDDHGRFHRALEALNSARGHIKNEEDNVYARGLQHRALVHINKAREAVRHVIEN